MNVLFYGGCHAYVLKNTFKAFASEDHNFDCLINFDLIRSGKPFPWNKALEYDAIVFSPIKHVDYPTEKLIKFCDKHGIRHISYPWMQWNGYFPDVKKGDFLNGISWMYPNMHEDDGGLSPDRIKENFETSNALLSKFESHHQTDISIYRFVRENFREKRLFLTPDHPTAFLYKHLVRRVADRLDIDLDLSYWLSAHEPQGGIKVPIRPGVAEVLDLDFVDADFENCTAFGTMTFPWLAYVQLYELKAGRIFEAKTTTIIKDHPVDRTKLKPSEMMTISAGDFMVFEAAQQEPEHGHIFGEILLARKSQYSKMTRKSGYVFANHWTEKKIGLI